MRRRTTDSEPPSTTRWRVDGELRGHSVSETAQYLSDCADFADEIAERQRHGEDFIISTPSEPFWRRFRWTW
jgi:hypothetical protein